LRRGGKQALKELTLSASLWPVLGDVPVSDRLSKEGRKELKKPDAFVAWGRKKVEELAGSTRQISILVGVIVLGVFGWYGFTRWQAGQSEKAWEAFYEAYKIEEPGRWAALEKMYADNSGSRAGSYAAVVLGDHFLSLAKATVDKQLEVTPPAAAAGKGAKKSEPNFAVNLTALPVEKENSAKAAEWYTKASKFSGLASEEKQLLEINVANAYEIAGELKKADEAYQAAAKTSAVSKGLAMMSTGRVAEMQGQKDRAVQIYQDIIKEFSGTEKNREYERLAQSALRRVQTRLFNEPK
jgi:tetratricopeptide (TPR) repeat protein